MRQIKPSRSLLFPAALAVAGSLVPSVVSAASITITNPSFEANPVPGGAGYGSINGWTAVGGSGLNSGGPFADNGSRPDGNQVAFIQQTGSLSQELSGLVAGSQYWLQAYVNARSVPPNDLPLASVSFGGMSLLQNQPVPSVGGTNPYHKVNIPFTALGTSGTLFISTAPSTVGGDSALLLDGITLIQRDPGEVVIYNPSFEASGTGLPFPGYLSNIAGWTSTPGTGTPGSAAINVAAGPFNGVGFVPEGQNLAVLQNSVGLSQTLSGVTPGSPYRLTLDYEARSGGDPTVLISIDGKTALSGLVLQTTDQYRLTYDFIASSSTPVLNIENMGIGADTSLLFDNVSLRLIPEPGSISLTLAAAGLALLRRKRV